MAWYKTGDEGVEQARREDEQRQRDLDSPFRFWLPADKSAKIVFLDTDGFFYKEHQFKSGGSWRNWETCISDIGEDECPLCEAGHRSSYVCVFSIIDLSKYTDRSGRQVTATKKLLVLKSQARVKVLKQKERNDNDLTYCVFEVTRFKPTECSTGEDFHLLQRSTKEEIMGICPNGLDPEEWVKPFDYVELFKPKTIEELRSSINVSPPVGSESSTGGSFFDKGSKSESGSKPASLKSLL